MEETQILKLLEKGDVGFDFVTPGLGGPQALVLLLDGEKLTRRGVAGGSGESEVGFGWGTVWDAGFRGLEEEYDKNQCGHGYGGIREPV